VLAACWFLRTSRLYCCFWHFYQWCSQDRNLQDRDLVKISRRDRDFIKNSETKNRDLKFKTETRDIKICAFFQKKNVVITSDLHFLISGIFPTCFGCFLPANTTNKKSLNYRNFEKPFLCNIQCLETWNLRDRYRDETWNLRDRDSKMDLETSLASRPWPSLQTPSLIFTALANAKKFQLMGMSNYMHIL